MTTFNPVRDYPKKSEFGSGDTLVVFGEVFERGYVNGLIDEALSAGVKVIYSTVGRRDENQKLRNLTPDEISAKNQSPLINIPLEAGFDLEPDKNGVRPVDQLKNYGLTGWEEAQLDWQSIQDSYERGTIRFREAVNAHMIELKKHINPNKNLIFAHIMAGGFPRAKVVMPIANRVFKGIGTRYLSSQIFWESEIGKLCEKSFDSVTSETFGHLIDLSKDLRDSVINSGGKVHYTAYGYHGNEVLIGGEYKWYSYSPYLQGFAKCKLEDVAKSACKNGLSATVFNVPEILTNSSSIFLGVEVVLYPLLRALKKEGKDSPKVKEIFETCLKKLKNGVTLAHIDQVTQEYLENPLVQSWPKLEGWPQHNGLEQMEFMRNASTQLIEMHKDQKNLITADLSELVFRACGKIMFHLTGQTHEAVLWIGHDAVAKATVSLTNS